MDTFPKLNINSVINNIITSYEARVEKIQTAFQSSEYIAESSHLLFDNVHNSLNDLKKERDILNSKLCETMAKNGSLRKKDYNIIMSGILDVLDAKEKEAEEQFLSFIEVQKEAAQSLKKNMLDINTSPDANGKVTIIKEQLSQISIQQEMSKESVMKTFIEFQKMHYRMTECFESLLKRGEDIMVQDIKTIKDQIIKEIN